MRTPYTIRRAEKKDASSLADLLSTSPRLHRHLDWRPPLDWLGSHPFWLAESDNRILAAMALPPDPPGVAWMHLFACAASANIVEMWDELFPVCLADPSLPPGTIIPSLALSKWYLSLLRRAGFSHYQNIVGLEREVAAVVKDPKINPDLFIRLMDPDDIEAVAAIDQQAFEPIWQNSLAQVSESFEQAAIATVAELGDEIVGFQITTLNMFTAHLARLAVKPGHQGQKIGKNILYDLFRRCKQERLWQITVNTQNTNKASLALYQGIGFRLSGDEFPVYLYHGRH